MLHRLFYAVAEGASAGLAVALLDVNNLVSLEVSAALFLIAGVFLGTRHGLLGLPAWPFVGGLLYVVHLIAMRHGYRQPFVERDTASVAYALMALVPAGFGLLSGAIGRLFLETLVRLTGAGPAQPRAARDYGDATASQGS